MPESKKKLLYIISGIDKALEFEWLAEAFKDEFSLSYILIGKKNSFLEKYLLEKKIDVFSINYSGKKDILRTWWKVFKFIKKTRPSIVHAHLFEASLIGLSAAKVASVKNRIYTRHHSNLHHKYFPGAVKYDRLCNRLATKIVAISPVVEDLLRNEESVPAEKITIIPHGIDLSSFCQGEPTAEVLNKYNPSSKKPVIGVISRFTHWKGIQYIIPAFQRLLDDFPNALLILANAKGDYSNEIDALLEEIPSYSYLKIQFEEDVVSLYRLFDVFVHVPVDSTSEAFGQIYLEAMAVQVPMVCTISGIAHQLVRDKENAIVVNHESSTDIYEKTKMLLADIKLFNKIAKKEREDVLLYSVEEKIGRHRNLYNTMQT